MRIETIISSPDVSVIALSDQDWLPLPAEMSNGGEPEIPNPNPHEPEIEPEPDIPEYDPQPERPEVPPVEPDEVPPQEPGRPEFKGNQLGSSALINLL